MNAPARQYLDMEEKRKPKVGMRCGNCTIFAIGFALVSFLVAIIVLAVLYTEEGTKVADLELQLQQVTSSKLLHSH